MKIRAYGLIVLAVGALGAVGCEERTAPPPPPPANAPTGNTTPPPAPENPPANTTPQGG